MYEIGLREAHAVAQVFKNGKLFRYRGGEGGRCDQFETALAKKTGVKHALLTTSGTAALCEALVGLGLGPGDEAIVPGYTYMATALAVLAVGAIPIIAEVDETLLLDPRDVERKITRFTKVIVPVHMVGRACHLTAIGRIARGRGLKVLEDACQAVGGSYRGRRLGSWGDAGAFSFNYFKNITCGEGGAVVTNNRRLYNRARIYHDGGAVFRDYAAELEMPIFAGQNFRASEVQGAIMMVQLRRLNIILTRLRARAAAMREELAKSKCFSLSPCHEVDGDCGTVVPLIFESEAAAKEAVRRINDQKIPISAGRPIDSGRHVYVNWEPILKKIGNHHPQLNPYNWARRKIEYAPDMCPRTLDVLARTVMLSTPYRASVRQARAWARQITG